MASFKVETKESIDLLPNMLLEFIKDFLFATADNVELSLSDDFWESEDYADALEEIAKILCKKAEEVRDKAKEETSITVTEEMLDFWSDFCSNTCDCADCPFDNTPEICEKVCK